MEKVLVTGGAGFIGSHLLHELLKYGYEVVVLDNFSTGSQENIDAAMVGSDGVELDCIPPVILKGGVEDPDLVRHAVEGCHYVFHVAALGSVPRSVEEPIPSHEANVTGTLTLLHACKEVGVRKVVFSSSSSVYGDAECMFKRETLPFKPKTPYAAQKCLSEYYMKMYWTLHKVPTICLRYFNVFGPRQSAQSEYAAVIPRIIRACIDDSYEFEIHGDGKQSRDFTYVSNVVRANIQAMLSLSPETTGESYNIAMGDTHSINTLVSTISEITGSTRKFTHTAPRVGDIRHSMADTFKANDQLRYRPEVGFMEGMKVTVASYLQ